TGRMPRARSTSAASRSSGPPTSTRPCAGRAGWPPPPGCRSRCARCRTDMTPSAVTADHVEQVFRREYGRVVSVLIGRFGDIDLAEECAQDAFAVALERWPADGMPPSPVGWIVTTARNRALDRLRREQVGGTRHTDAVVLGLT